jgi:nucleoid DNA-binding protein
MEAEGIIDPALEHSIQPWETIMAKKKSGKTPAVVRPIKETLTKSALISTIAEQNEMDKKTVAGVLATLECIVMGAVHPKGVGEFTWPGLMKVTLRKVPARKAGTLIRNPATGEMMPAAAKPASVRVKVRALSKLKKTATGN